MSSVVYRLSSANNNAPPVHPGRGARSWCHPGLSQPHGRGLSGLRRPGLVTGGAGLDLPLTWDIDFTDSTECSSQDSWQFVVA
jgi:hypothetical protein